MKSIITKLYIVITDKRIDLKLSAFKAKIEVAIDDIIKIDRRVVNFVILMKSGIKITILFSKLSTSQLQEIERSLSEIGLLK